LEGIDRETNYPTESGFGGQKPGETECNCVGWSQRDNSVWKKIKDSISGAWWNFTGWIRG
ncbi:phage protein, partial [Peptoniphilus indolicus ATCC 29427]